MIDAIGINHEHDDAEVQEKMPKSKNAAQCSIGASTKIVGRGIVMFLTATISLLSIYLLRPGRIAKRVNNDVLKSCHHGKKCILIHHIHAGVNVATFRQPCSLTVEI